VSDVLIPLKNGPAVTKQAILFMTDCESRGITFRLKDDGLLWLGPKTAVSPDDLAFAKQYKADLVALVTYVSQVSSIV
jgi:hypothetical protein